MTSAIDTGANVASFQKKRRQRRGQTRSQAMLSRLGKILHESVETALPALLDEADDRLFELAERADTNQLQTQYFEAMRTVRMARKDIEARFLKELAKAMSRRLGDAAGDADGEAASLLDTGNFKLIEDDEFEENVAVKNISSKLRNICHGELFALDRRVGFVLGDSGLEGEDNPFAPECLANAANGALREVELSLEVRLVLLKLVNRHLVKGAHAAYREMNQFLVANGVLPEVRQHAAAHPRAEGTRSHAQHHAAQSTKEHWVRVAAEGLGADSAPQHAAGVGVGMAEGPLGSGVGAFASEQVLGVLGDVMSISGAQGLNAIANAADAARAMGDFTALQRDPRAIQGGANMLRELHASSSVAALNQVDGLMIDVVAMMFDYILDDDNIVESVRALVARLQIPVLKVAILDKTFFARRTHPARQFVNHLAEMGARMNDAVGEGDPIYDRLDAVVHKLLEDFEADLGIFNWGLKELEVISSSEDEVADENAWQAAKVAEERARLDECKRLAGEEVRTRIEAEQPASAIQVFLDEHWRHLLATRLYQNGVESKEWRACVQTMDNLVWSASPKATAGEKDRLLAMLPFLLQRLKSGMDELCLSKAVRQEFLRSLSEFHVEAIRPAEEARAEPAGGESASTRETPSRPSAKAEVIAQPAVDEALEFLRGAVEKANALVFETAEKRIQCKGMGTTVVALKLDGPRVLCAHVGDSRAYRLRDGECLPITRDHTYRQQMIDRGRCTVSEAQNIAGNLITRAVGSEAQVQVDVAAHPAAAGDVYLLCSDGLSDMLADEDIHRIITESMAREDDLEAISEQLVAAANAAGGRDNVSVAMLRMDAIPLGAGSDGSVGLDHSSFIATGAATDSGRVRPHNEDSVDVAPRLGLAVLADGMGGHNAGEVASAMTVRVIMGDYSPDIDVTDRASEQGQDSQPEVPASAVKAFDFDAINASFWDDSVSGDERERMQAALAEQAESITLGSVDALDDAFDIGKPRSKTRVSRLDGDAAVDPFLKRVLALSEGAWVEFSTGSARAGTRASLSWVAEDRSRYLFTGRLGQKVAESTPHGLALEMRKGRLRLLDSVPLLDRAINHLSARVRAANAGAA